MDDLQMLGTVLDDALETEIVRIIYKDGTAGLFTRIEEKVKGEEPPVISPNTVPAFNINSEEWELVMLERIDIAEAV
jgi:hypothetical protein